MLVSCFHRGDGFLAVVHVEYVVAPVLQQPIPPGVGADHVLEQVVELLTERVVLEGQDLVSVFFGQAPGLGVADRGVDFGLVSVLLELAAQAVQRFVGDGCCFVALVGAEVYGY